MNKKGLWFWSKDKLSLSTICCQRRWPGDDPMYIVSLCVVQRKLCPRSTRNNLYLCLAVHFVLPSSRCPFTSCCDVPSATLLLCPWVVGRRKKSTQVSCCCHSDTYSLLIIITIICHNEKDNSERRWHFPASCVQAEAAQEVFMKHEY